MSELYWWAAVFEDDHKNEWIGIYKAENSDDLQRRYHKLKLKFCQMTGPVPEAGRRTPDKHKRVEKK